MGVHTGDSITVAPAQTLTDVEYQQMRDAAFACIRRVGVETGGSNVQFAVDPGDRRHGRHRDEPARVAQSSALASKATGFPIAKIAAKLAVGYTLDEIPNDITRETPACFEPTIDYVVTKIPRWAFEKLPGTTRRARHADAVGRRGDGDRAHVPRDAAEGAALARDRAGSGSTATRPSASSTSSTDDELRAHGRDRHARAALPARGGAARAASPIERIYDATRVDPWFLDQMPQIVEERDAARRAPASTAMTRRDWRRAKRLGFSDAPARATCGASPRTTCARRALAAGVRATYKTVDTCAAEFAADTPYHYSTYEDEDEVAPADQPEGGDPRLRARTASARASSSTTAACTPLRAARRRLRDGHGQLQPGDGVHRLRHQRPPLLRAAHRRGRAQRASSAERRPGARGVIVALGGQTPLKLAGDARRRSSWLGTSPDVDRRSPRTASAGTRCAHELEHPAAAGRHRGDRRRRRWRSSTQSGYPVLVRPSYVLGGRAMQIVYDDDDLRAGDGRAAPASAALGREGGLSAERPVLIDRFLEDAIEVDVDAIRDHTGEVLIGGVMEHVEEAGVHSGDSACAIPPPDAVRRGSSR